MGVVTPEFRVSYPKVFKAEWNKLSKKNEYSLVALFPAGETLAGLKQLAYETCVKKWGEDRAKWPKNLRLPFKDQADREKTLDDGTTVMPDGYVKGALYLNLKSSEKYKPAIVDENVQPILSEADFYGGCYARASVGCYAYDHGGNCGVSFGLGNVQKTRDGEPFGGRLAPEAEFSPVQPAAGQQGSAPVDPFL